MGTPIRLTRAALAAIRAHALRDAPHEACGLLLGGADGIEKAVPAANVAPDPARHFAIDPAALIAAHRAARSGGPALLGYYHSHPSGPAEPSAEDQRQAAGDDRIWAICALREADQAGHPAIRLWRDGPDGFEPLSHCPADG